MLWSNIICGLFLTLFLSLSISFSLSIATVRLNIRDNFLRGEVPLALGDLSSIGKSLCRSRSETGIPHYLMRHPLLTFCFPSEFLRLDVNNLTGDLPPALCENFDLAKSTFYADCDQLSCPCCNYCCEEAVPELCTCEYEDVNPILCLVP